jgi:hypothetical protein
MHVEVMLEEFHGDTHQLILALNLQHPLPFQGQHQSVMEAQQRLPLLAEQLEQGQVFNGTLTAVEQVLF